MRARRGVALAPVSHALARQRAPHSGDERRVLEIRNGHLRTHFPEAVRRGRDTRIQDATAVRTNAAHAHACLRTYARTHKQASSKPELHEVGRRTAGAKAEGVEPSGCGALNPGGAVLKGNAV